MKSNGESFPEAGALEKVVLDWVRDLAGFPETSSGYITSGGTASNMMACMCAKHKHGINADNVARYGRTKL